MTTETEPYDESEERHREELDRKHVVLGGAAVQEGRRHRQAQDPAIAGFTVLLGAGLALMYAYYSCVYAAIQDVVEPSLRGTAMALYFFAMYVLGGSLGPVGTGMLSDHFARKAMSAAGATAMAEPFKATGLHHAMEVIPLLSLLVALVLYAASRTVAADMEKLRRRLNEPDPTSAPSGEGGGLKQ